MLPSPQTPPAVPFGKNFRWFLLALLFCVSFLNFVDRATLSVLKETLMPVFEMGESDYANLVNAFTACYAGAYIISGWMVDRIGPRLALLIFAGLWSIVTIGCGLAQSFAQLILFRALLGLAEPGLAPVSIRVATAWAPANSRGLFMNLCSVGGSIGNIAAASIVVWLTTITGTWRWAFIIPGVLGVGIAAVWWFCYRDPEQAHGPESHEAKNHGLAARAAPAPVRTLTWGELWGTRALWGIVLARLISDPVWYFILFWLPGYLEKQQSVPFGSLGISGIPFLASFIGGLVMSILSDRFAKSHKTDPLLGRKRLLYAVSIAGPLCIVVPYIDNIVLTMAVFCVIAVVCISWLSTLAPIIAEIFPIGNVASIWGIAGAFGAGGAFVFNKLLGHVGQPGFPLSLNQLFLIMGFLHLVAALILYVLVRRPAQAHDKNI